MQRQRDVGGRRHAFDSGVLEQKVPQLLERRLFIVDGKYVQPGHDALTPGAHFGTRKLTFVPASTPVSTTSP